MPIACRIKMCNLTIFLLKSRCPTRGPADGFPPKTLSDKDALYPSTAGEDIHKPYCH